MYAEPAPPIWAAVRASPLSSSVSGPPRAPTMVTARPSRIHTVPRPMMTIQCHFDHGRRSIRAGMFVSMVRSVAPSLAKSLTSHSAGLAPSGYPSRTASETTAACQTSGPGERGRETLAGGDAEGYGRVVRAGRDHRRARHVPLLGADTPCVQPARRYLT